MKLEVGMYVRTKEGRIAKITDNNTYCTINDKEVIYVENNEDVYGIYGFMILKEMIIKASHNIIDLIEPKDIIVGIDGHIFEIYAVGSDCVYINGLKEFIYEHEIKSIVTKEQFENMEYKVGE